MNRLARDIIREYNNLLEDTLKMLVCTDRLSDDIKLKYVQGEMAETIICINGVDVIRIVMEFEDPIINIKRVVIPQEVSDG